jgi:hypothetical protein
VFTRHNLMSLFFSLKKGSNSEGSLPQLLLLAEYCTHW